MVPSAVLSTPELQKQAEKARKAQQEEQQKEMRRLMPPLRAGSGGLAYPGAALASVA
jgi:hypothetical protein